MADQQLPDLTGTVDERLATLRELDVEGSDMSIYWLYRQLERALSEWADEESQIDAEVEARVDF